MCHFIYFDTGISFHSILVGQFACRSSKLENPFICIANGNFSFIIYLHVFFQMIDFSNDIINCLDALNKGEIILYPTDTVWGIGCDATNEEAVEKIINLKNRPQDKSFVVLVSSEKEVLKYTAATDLSVFDFLSQQKKPTTIVYENALGIAQNALANDGSAAIRICNESFCKTLLQRFKKPLISTSANLSGESTPQSFSAIKDTIKKNVDYIVKYKQDDMSYSQPSAILKWIGGKPQFIRE